MSDTLVVSALAIGLATPIMFVAGWYAFAVIRRSPPSLRDQELVLRKGNAHLWTGDSPAGKLGSLVLTDQRVIWEPIPFPFPGMQSQSVELTDVKRCALAEREATRLVRLIEIRVQERSIKLNVGPGNQENWIEAIEKAKSERLGRTSPK